jgi:hypothetical protein
MRPLPIDISEQYGFWKVIYNAHSCNARGTRIVLCQCRCLSIREVPVRKLLRGRASACKKCAPRISTLRHGHARRGAISITWRSWLSMMRRCYDPSHVGWENYGGRGIQVYEPWHRFEAFVEAVGERPSQDYTLDRHPDPNGRYEPGNVRWATKIKQARNRRTTKRFNGVSLES